MARGLTLRPRYLTAGRNDFARVGAVLLDLEKEKKRASGKGTEENSNRTPGRPGSSRPSGPRVEIMGAGR